MKLFLIIIFSVLTNLKADNLINSIWSHQVATKCVNTLTFKPDGLVLEYNCELNYAFNSNYKVKGDTITIKGKDDSHSEDNGKITSYWITTYLIKQNALYVINNKMLINGKWQDRKIVLSKTPAYRRIK